MSKYANTAQIIEIIEFSSVNNEAWSTLVGRTARGTYNLMVKFAVCHIHANVAESDRQICSNSMLGLVEELNNGSLKYIYLYSVIVFSFKALDKREMQAHSGI